MKHRWISLLWELWAALALCAAAALPPGSVFGRCPALVFPGLVLSAAVPAAWAAWAVLAELPAPPEPEQFLEPATPFDFSALCDFSCAAAAE